MENKSLHSHHYSAILVAKPEIYHWSDRDFLHCLHQFIRQVSLTAVGELAHSFQPHGVSVVVLLEESHVALHFWPEIGKISVDIHLCDFNQNNHPKAIELAEQLSNTLSHHQPHWHSVSIAG
jgi:S-adenosylmethionine decarboxylase